MPIIKTEIGNKRIKSVSKFQLFGERFSIHPDIFYTNLFVCTHNKSGFRLPFYCDSVKECINVSLSFLKYKDKEKVLDVINEALKNDL